MERGEAIERVRKLSEITVERGATPNEQEVATRKAERLIERFSLQLADFAPPQPSPPPPPMWGQGQVFVNGQPIPASATGVRFTGPGISIYVRFG